MNKLLLVVSSNRDVSHEVNQCIDRCLRAGAGLVIQRGTADVALARNLALSMTCDTFRAFPDRDVALMLDDDIIFTDEQVAQIVARVRETRHAAAGMYATTGATIAASSVAAPDGKWLVGLGFVAIHRDALLALEQQSAAFKFRDKTFRAFTWCGVEGEGWRSEDYKLSERLGGVELLAIGVGHLKRLPIYPDDVTLQSVAQGRPLPEGDGRPVSLTERLQ